MNENSEKYIPPQGKVSENTLAINEQSIPYQIHTDWIILRKEEKASAEMFYTAYLSKDKDSSQRPITFIFNGGPGASSAFLHLGACGPKRILFKQDGSAPAPPVKLVDNLDTWLPFTDLVFIDPIGTGFSRTIKQESVKNNEDCENKKDENEYYSVKRDIESLGEFIQKFLSRFRRWDSPVFISGESYGGFRVATLSKKLQDDYGVGLNGVIIISPALEFALLDPCDYDIQSWSDIFPSMVLTAAYHNKSRVFNRESSPEEVVKKTEQFASNQLTRLLVQGGYMEDTEKRDILKDMAAYLGIPEKDIITCHGRLPNWSFCKKLLEEENLICGLYDASITGVNPYPDRNQFLGPDQSLASLNRVFNSGINSLLRKNFELELERDYHLLNMKVHMAWKNDVKRHAFQRQVGATDDLRYGMALNPDMKVIIIHGYFDLVTPYYSSKRIINQMRLHPHLEKNISLRALKGGHMFYTWDDSRAELREIIDAFYRGTTK